MLEVRPLPIYPHDFHQYLPVVKEAKAALDWDFLVKPVPAVPGSPGRIVAFGEAPNFLCDYALVSNRTVESVTAALKWWSDPEDLDSRAVYVIDMLKEQFGPDVTEIPTKEKVESNVKFE